MEAKINNSNNTSFALALYNNTIIYIMFITHTEGTARLRYQWDVFKFHLTSLAKIQLILGKSLSKVATF